MEQTMTSSPISRETALSSGPRAAAPVQAGTRPPASAQVIGKTHTGRLPFIDNLRWVMIMLVLSMHAAVTYSHLGSWYYVEDSPVGPIQAGIFATYQATLQSFFMGFLFFIAGYFVPGAYDKKGPGKFLGDRAFRLGIPLLLYVFILQPVAVYCMSLFHGPDTAPQGFLHLYGRYISTGRWLGGTGPLWFCEALLIFCLGYALFRVFARMAPGISEGRKGVYGETGAGAIAAGAGVGGDPGKTFPGGDFPGKTRIWGFIILITVLTFLVRFPWPNGTSFYNLQFCYFSQYVLFFIAGTMAFRGHWLDKLSTGDGNYWRRVALIGGSICWVALLALGGAFKGGVSAYQGGLHWQSLGMSFWESMCGVGLSLYFLVLFRERFNKQGKWAGFFSANAFAVYVFHPPVLIAISRMMGGLQWPPLLKFVILTLLSIVVTYALCAWVIRRIPLLKRVL